MGLFQNTGARAQAKPGETRLSLGAFGKHPGWDDHIVGIGVETELLAHTKQTLYVGGIGRQIDAGAWEKLEPGKRSEGFDHTVFWFRGGHLLLGRFWSSVDRKGRAKYPMVLCIDSEGLSPAALMANGAPELEKLKDKCKAVNTSEQVTAECGATQERLRTGLDGATQPVPDLEQRKRFINSPAFGQEHVGLMRVVHELDNALGVSSGSRSSGSGMANLHPYHIRVPLGHGTPKDALVLWADFLRTVLPHSVPLMLIARDGVEWLDVIVGEPSGADFFCLQATPLALPYATEIPYELGPDLMMRWPEMESHFLSPEASEMTGGTIFIKKTTSPGASGGTGTMAKPKRKGWLWLVFAVVALAAAGAVIFLAMPNADKRYQQHLQAAQAALAATNIVLAQQEFDEAVKAKPADATGLKLKTEIDARQREASSVADADQKYQQAIRAGKGALERQDYLGALSQADAALAIRPNDAAAGKLKGDAQAKQRDTTAQADGDVKYRLAMAAATAAMSKQDYTNVIAQSDLALGGKPNDATAQKLKDDAAGKLREIAAREESEKNYKAAMAAAQSAVTQQDFAGAARQADAALTAKPGDVTATKLKNDSQARALEVAAKAEDERKFKAALAAAQTAFDRQDYAVVLTQANIALGLKPTDGTATQLLMQAREKKMVQEQATLAAKEAAAIPPPPAPVTAPVATPQPKTVAVVKTSVAIPVVQTADAIPHTTGLDTFDMTLRNLMIQLHVKPGGTNVTTNSGTAAPLLRGNLPPDTIDQYDKLVQNLRKVYTDNKWLDAERKKDLDHLHDAILDWNQ